LKNEAIYSIIITNALQNINSIHTLFTFFYSLGVAFFYYITAIINQSLIKNAIE